ncbi:MAG: hypothetical protein E7Z88_01805 [Cyanobacteria bacterium SIG27]|nr:hypothetical protein [Cyanobacteria bacterium SIG27]
MKKILVFSFLLNFKSFADEQILSKSEQINEVLSKNPYEPNYFSMILGLFVVVGLIYLTGFLYQKLTKATIANDDYLLNKAQIISTTSLGQGRNLHVIKIGSEGCLIGSTQNNITFIKDVQLQTQKLKEEVDEKNS